MNAQITTGTANLHMEIDNGIAARTESHTDLGKITVNIQSFSGNQTSLQSNNYPETSNFLLNLSTTTDGITINAAYLSSTNLSKTRPARAANFINT